MAPGGGKAPRRRVRRAAAAAGGRRDRARRHAAVVPSIGGAEPNDRGGAGAIMAMTVPTDTKRGAVQHLIAAGVHHTESAFAKTPWTCGTTKPFSHDERESVTTPLEQPLAGGGAPLPRLPRAHARRLGAAGGSGCARPEAPAPSGVDSGSTYIGRGETMLGRRWLCHKHRPHCRSKTSMWTVNARKKIDEQQQRLHRPLLVLGHPESVLEAVPQVVLGARVARRRGLGVQLKRPPLVLGHP